MCKYDGKCIINDNIGRKEMIGILILPLSPREVMALADWEDVDMIQASLENLVDKISIETIEELAATCKAQNKMLAYHAPSKDLNLGSLNDGARREAIRQIEKAIRLVGSSAKFVTVHSGLAPRFAGRGSMERCVAALRHLSELAEECGTMLSVENVFEESLDQLIDYIRLVEPYHLGITFDVAHAMLYSKMSIATVFSVLGNSIIDVHLSRPEQAVDSHLPLYLGWSVIDEIQMACTHADYAGAVTIEVNNISDARSSILAYQGKINGR